MNALEFVHPLQELLSPSQTPQSSIIAIDPQILSQPDGAGSPQPHPKSILPSQSHEPSGIPLPPQTPHSSSSRQEPSSIVALES